MNFSVSAARRAALSLKFILQISNARYYGRELRGLKE